MADIRSYQASVPKVSIMGVSKHTSRQERTTTEWVSYAVVVNFSNLKSPPRETVRTPDNWSWILINSGSPGHGVQGRDIYAFHYMEIQSSMMTLAMNGGWVLRTATVAEFIQTFPRNCCFESHKWTNIHVVVEYVMTIEHLERLSVAQDSYWELETKTNKAGERIKNIRCLWSPDRS